MLDAINFSRLFLLISIDVYLPSKLLFHAPTLLTWSSLSAVLFLRRSQNFFLWWIHRTNDDLYSIL